MKSGTNKLPRFDFLILDHERFPGNQQVEEEFDKSLSSLWSLTNVLLDSFLSTHKISLIHVNC
jgi:hypothetical protein